MTKKLKNILNLENELNENKEEDYSSKYSSQISYQFAETLKIKEFEEIFTKINIILNDLKNSLKNISDKISVNIDKRLSTIFSGGEEAKIVLDIELNYEFITDIIKKFSDGKTIFLKVYSLFSKLYKLINFIEGKYEIDFLYSDIEKIYFQMIEDQNKEEKIKDNFYVISLLEDYYKSFGVAKKVFSFRTIFLI